MSDGVVLRVRDRFRVHRSGQGFPDAPAGRQFPTAARTHERPRTAEEQMADEPRDTRPEIRLSQLSHGAG